MSDRQAAARIADDELDMLFDFKALYGRGPLRA